ncbi:MAG: hypothetical protein ACOYZ6_02535 [Chloroflexota bacterium]
MTRNLVCSECGGKMEKGIIVDTGDAGTPFGASYWMEGVAEKNWLGILITRKKKKYYITAFRCETCSFLKLYAGSDQSSEKTD